ncbi:phage tail tape measure protein [Serratia marcescens]|uniref:phage tail tape measure protein n=1 Tax=Serratia marcescens TaxID=615 RepID=UPI00197F3C7B|nr:phage tail tape measure protein [Serratia marcescens]MBN3978309.1 phage tail tape measure protein [Serratia marcescens]
MAGKSLGTLTIDLIAKVGGFVSGMDKAERASEQWRKKVESNIKSAGNAVAGLAGLAATASVAVTGIGVALLKTTSDQITETDRWAKSLGTSTQTLLEWQYAAKQAGLTGDNIADIFKDLNDKIGDAVLNNSGEAAQALDTLGLSAKKLQVLSPDKQLLAIADAMKGMNTAQKTTILESLGNDLSKMIPLFENGNEKLNAFIQKAKDFGIAPPQSDIDKLLKVNEAFQEIEGSWDGFKTKMATGLAEIDLGPLVDSVHSLEKTLTDPAVLQGIVNIANGLTQVVNLLAQGAKFANDMAYGWGKTASTSADSSFNELLAKRKELNKSLAYSESLLGKLDVAAGVIRSSEQIRAEISKNEKLISQFNQGLPTGPATISAEGSLTLGKGETNSKQPKGTKPKVNSGAIKIENAFKATEQAYLRQIELIDTNGKKSVEVTEKQKLAFDLSSGKLTGLNDSQKERLKLLAEEVDRLNAVKKASENNIKVAQFASALHRENEAKKEGLDADFIGAYSGEDQRGRMREMASIREDFARRQTELQTQLDSGDIDKDLYDKKSQALSDSLQEQLSIQEDYYKKVDELRNNWTAGFMSGLATQIEASMDLYSNMQQVGAHAFSSLTDMIIEWAETGKLNAKDFAASFLQSIGTALLSYAAAQVAMAGLSAFSSMIGVPFVGPAVAPGAAVAAAAAAGVLAIGVSSALKGQAHDGIDSVPETGTWLLQKGERVTTAKTSAKLDATLERVSRDANSGGNAPFAPVTNLTVNGDPDKSTLRAIEAAVARGNNQLYGKITQDVLKPQGQFGNALKSRYVRGYKE